MAVTDSRVKFLRGLLASLPSTKTDGNIYITTDERAMYVDYNDGQTVQRIRLGDFREYENMEAINAIPTTNLSTTALYYATTENILAKWTGTRWKQINPQKSIGDLIRSIEDTVALSSNTATVTTTIKNEANVPVLSTNHSVATADANAIKLSVSGSTITMRGRLVDNEVSPVLASATNGATVTLRNTYTGTDSAGAAVNTTTDKAFNLLHNASGGVKVSVNAAGDTVTLDADYRLAGLTADSNKALVLGLTNINGGTSVIPETSRVKITPTITVGDGTTTTVDATVTYSGTSQSAKAATINFNLPVYTKAQVDTKIADSLTAMNSMTFKGNIKSSGGTVQTPPLDANAVKIGDTYIVADNTGNYDTNTTGGRQGAIKGDLFIATSTDGTENSLGYIEPAKIQWVYVPSGDDASHEYALKKATSAARTGTNAQAAFDYIYLKNEANVIQGPGIGVGAGIEYDMLTSNDTVAGSVMVLKHKVYSAPTATPDTAVALNNTTQTGNLNGTITAITGLTLENGHITGYTTQQYGVTLASAWTDTRIAASVSSGKGVLTSQYKTAAGGNSWVGSQTMSLSSQSLTFAKVGTANELSVDLMWETF